MDGTYCGAAFGGGYSRKTLELPTGLELQRYGVEACSDDAGGDVDEFEAMIVRFCSFVDSNGHLPFLKRDGSDGIELRRWFDCWSKAYDLNQMSKDRRRQWESRWQLMIDGGGKKGVRLELARKKCLDFVHAHGYLPKKRHDPELAEELAKIRSRYQRGTMTDREKEGFDAIPGWYWTKKEEWEENFESLREAISRKRLTKENVSWIFKQAYSYREGGMPAERIPILNGLAPWILTSDIPKSLCCEEVRRIKNRARRKS